MTSIDVVVPCYQYGRYLRDCVISILGQDVPNLRVLIIDNGSTDQTSEVARNLCLSDARVQLRTHSRNIGQHAVYNEGIDWASANYMMILDADDVLTPGSLVRALAVMEAHPKVSFAHGVELWRYFNAGETIDSAEYRRRSPWTIGSGLSLIARMCESGCNLVGSNTVLRRTHLQKEVGHYCAALPHTDDMEMWLRLAMVGDVAETQAVQTVRRLHSGQASVEYRSSTTREFEERRRAFFSFFNRGALSPDLCIRLRRTAERGIARSALWHASQHLRNGEVEASYTLLRYARGLSLGRVLRAVLRWPHLFLWPPKRVRDVFAAAMMSGDPVREPNQCAEERAKTVSVVIPTMHRPDDLHRALCSISAQTNLPDEVIIVDQSTDGRTAEVCRAAGSTGSLAGRLCYLRQETPGSARARNRGALISQSDIVSFIDDDVVLHPDYYHHVMAAFSADASIGAVGGSVSNVAMKGIKWSLRQALACLFFINFWNGRMTVSGFGYPIYHRPINRKMRVEMLHGCNMSVRRSAVDGEWFDDWFTGYSFREDAEFSYRVSRRWKVIMIPEARLDHNESQANRLPNAERKSMEVRNYAYVWRKHRGNGLVSRALFMYSLAGLLLIEWLESIGNAQGKAATFQSALDAVRTLRIRA